MYPPPMPFLIAEDLALLLTDPTSGKPRRSLSDQLLGGAILVDLGLLGLVRTERSGLFRSRKVTVTGAPPPDPMLGNALSRVVGVNGSPMQVGRALGQHARTATLERLVSRGVLRHQEKRTLGFRSSIWPANDVQRRQQIGNELTAMLLHGATGQQRSIALASILVKTGLTAVALGLHPTSVRRIDMEQNLTWQTSGWDVDVRDVIDACVDACGDGGSDGDGGGSDGGDGGGDGGGGGGD